MISHEHKCIFIHIPKCAGTSSIERALGHHLDYAGRGKQDHRSIREIEPIRPIWKVVGSFENIELSLRAFKDRNKAAANPRNKLTLTRSQYVSYFKFTIVRNPWARAYSWYQNVMRDEIRRSKLNISSDLSFKDYLRTYAGKGMLRPQTYWIKDFSGSIPLDFVGKFENLASDFDVVCETLGVSDISLPHLLGGSSVHFQEHYDKRSIALIDEMYRQEIELFGYSFK